MSLGWVLEQFARDNMSFCTIFQRWSHEFGRPLCLAWWRPNGDAFFFSFFTDVARPPSNHHLLGLTFIIYTSLCELTWIQWVSCWHQTCQNLVPEHNTWKHRIQKWQWNVHITSSCVSYIGVIKLCLFYHFLWWYKLICATISLKKVNCKVPFKKKLKKYQNLSGSHIRTYSTFHHLESWKTLYRPTWYDNCGF